MCTATSQPLQHVQTDIDKFDEDMENGCITQHLRTVYRLLCQRPTELVATVGQSSPCTVTVVSLPLHLLSHVESLGSDSAATLFHTPIWLTTQQLTHRKVALQVLQAYIERRQYPVHHSLCKPAASGTDLVGRLPAFIDDVTGIHCAVGHMLAATAKEGVPLAAALDRIAHTWTVQQMVSRYETLTKSHVQLDAAALQQQAALSALLHWQQAHGFTLAELALIQPSYPLRTERPPEPAKPGLIERVAQLQQMDGSFDTSQSSMNALAEVLEIPVLGWYQTVWSRKQRVSEVVELHQFTQLMVAAALELRFGVLPEMLATANSMEHPPRGTYPHYVAAINDLACSVLRGLFNWLSQAARTSHNPADVTKLSIDNFTAHLRDAREWAIWAVPQVRAPTGW